MSSYFKTAIQSVSNNSANKEEIDEIATQVNTFLTELRGIIDKTRDKTEKAALIHVYNQISDTFRIPEDRYSESTVNLTPTINPLKKTADALAKDVEKAFKKSDNNLSFKLKNLVNTICKSVGFKQPYQTVASFSNLKVRHLELFQSKMHPKSPPQNIENKNKPAP